MNQIRLLPLERLRVGASAGMRFRGGLSFVLLSVLLLHTSSMFAQTTGFTTCDIVAKAGNVSIIVKDNDYRMIVGTTKKPKLNMTMGFSKEQAISFVDRIIDFSSEDYTKKNRNVSLYGMMFFLTITGQGENETFHFVEPGKKVKFALSTKDLNQFKKAIENQGLGGK